jgi:apolipoprotein N-acyltransferase
MLPLVALAASAAALWFGTGLHPLWWLTWFAPVPVLLAAARLSRRSTFALALLAWAIGGLNMWSYCRATLHIPPVAALGIVVLPALAFALCVLVYRAVLRASAWRAALIFPGVWVLYEFLAGTFSPHGAFGDIGYSQMDFLPLLQLASVTGIWGIGFCLFLFAATLGVLLSRRGNPREKRRLALAVAAVFILVLGFGAWRLHSTLPAQNTVMVGLVASDLPRNILTEQPADTLRLLHDYADHAGTLAAQGARVIVMPEKVAVLLDSNLPEVDSLLRATASRTGASLLVGVIHPTPGARWNEARLYSPTGAVRIYEKHHLLPSFESAFKPGTARTVWREPSGLWGIAICKDMDFPPLGREYGRAGIGLLLVPAWDFNLDGWLHGRMAVLRGVESGFTIARAPKQGILAVTDNTGRVLAERQTGSAPFTSLLAAAPVRHTPTLYARFGDWFPWLDVAALICLVAGTITLRRN